MMVWEGVFWLSLLAWLALGLMFFRDLGDVTQMFIKVKRDHMIRAIRNEWRTVATGGALVLVMILSGCTESTVNTKRGAVGGAAAGAVVGGVIGHQKGRGLEGAAIGAAAGGAGGAVLGSAQDEKQSGRN